MITINKKSKLKVYPDWYELYSDVNIEYGGLFVNPDSYQAIEVIDLDSSSGVNYCNLIQRGTVFISEEMIRGGASCCGVESKVDSMVRVWKVFEKVYYSSHSRFTGNYPPGTQAHNLLLNAFELAFQYHGIDGYPDYSWLVLPKKTRTNPDGYTEKQAQTLVDEWRASEYVFSSDNGKAIRRILREQGITLRRK